MPFTHPSRPRDPSHPTPQPSRRRKSSAATGQPIVRKKEPILADTVVPLPPSASGGGGVSFGYLEAHHCGGVGVGVGTGFPSVLWHVLGVTVVPVRTPFAPGLGQETTQRSRRSPPSPHAVTISQQDHADALTFEILPASRNGIAPFPAAEPAAVLEAARASAPAPPVVSAGSLRASVHHIVIPSLRRKSDFFLLTPRPDHPAPNRRAGRVHRHSVLRHHLGLAGALRGESF